jgi:RNA polymerase primary sigma factor
MALETSSTTETTTQDGPDETQRHARHNSALDAYLSEIGNHEILTAEEEFALAVRAQTGDQAARDEMVEKNLKLVVKIAKDYEHLGVPLSDLISEGNIGLMKAVERFDPNRGARLSSYSAFWIKQRIRAALGNQSRPVRLPIHLISKIALLRKTEAAFYEETGRMPTENELAARLDISPRRLQQIQSAVLKISSLDANLDGDDSTSFADVIPDPKALAPGEKLQQRSLLKTVAKFLRNLTAREKAVLKLRYGLNGKNTHTLDQIALEFRISRERVRQIQNFALKKVRNLIDAYDGEGQRTTLHYE